MSFMGLCNVMMILFMLRVVIFIIDDVEAEGYLEQLLIYIADWAEKNYSKNFIILYKICKRKAKLDVRDIIIPNKSKKSKKSNPITPIKKQPSNNSDI